MNKKSNTWHMMMTMVTIQKNNVTMMVAIILLDKCCSHNEHNKQNTIDFIHHFFGCFEKSYDFFSNELFFKLLIKM